MWKFEEFKECQSNRWLCYITLTLTLTVGWYGIVFGMPTAPIKFGLAILLFAAGTIFAFFQHFHNLSAKEQPVLDGWMWALNTVLFTGVLITAFYYSFQFQPADSKAGYISYVCYLLKRGIYSLTEKQIYSGDCMLLLSLFLSQIVVWIAESIKSAAILKKHKDKYSKKFLFFAPYGLVP